MDHELEPESIAGTAGFTLIELLVAIAVLAVLALGATLALPRAISPAIHDMTLFKRQFETMRQLAITGQSRRGLIIEPRGLRLASHQSSDQEFAADQGQGHRQEWRLSSQQQRWQGRVFFAAREPENVPNRGSPIPQIQFLADGRSSAFTIQFSQPSGGLGQNSGRQQASCRSDGWTGLICSLS